jgi:predicted metal-dependent HD superfamily phosphohydrolase
MADRSALEQRWNALWSRIEQGRGPPGPGPPPPAFAPIAAAYGAPGRHYHTLDHLAHCFAELDAAVAAGLTHNPVALELAVWFHDLVYDPAAGDNEQRSARAAAAAINAFGGPHVDAVTRLIICTKHDRPPPTPG